MQRTEVDGVPVFWMDGQSPLAAVLIFRVGIRDEPFPRRGVTHLVEHLAMSRLGRRLHDYNASVDVAITTFEAAGPADAVASFLTDICVALHDLPTDRLDVERKVLAVETEDGGGIDDHHLLLRYGLRGPGLAGVVPPAPETLDIAAARDWASRRFLRSNAVIALNGPPPAELKLPLPDGPANVRPYIEPLDLGGPVWANHPGDRGLALSMHVPVGEAAAAAGRIATQRLTEEVRYRLGLAYDIDLTMGASASGVGGLLNLVADPPARTAGRAVAVVDTVFEDLRRDGATEDELAYDLAEGRAVREDPRSALDQAARAAVEHLHYGREWDPDTAWAERQNVGPADVCAVFADYPATALVTVPEGVVPQLKGYGRYPEHFGPPVSGREFRSRILGPLPRGARLIVGEKGVSLVLRDGAATVRWVAVAGYGEGPEDLRTLFGEDGCTMDLHPLFFKAGAEAMELIEAHIPLEARFPRRTEEPI